MERVSWPGPTYRVTATFRAPLEFVYRWCTDYTADDARHEGEHYERKVLERSSRQVMYEDLESSKDGWFWSRHVVRLAPPDRWHSDSVGSHRAISLEYRLRRLPGARTELTLTARRRPYGIGGKNPPKGKWERSVTNSWKLFARALEREYRKSRAPK
jgi:hypothetical protein